MEYTCNIPSPVGQLTLASDGERLTGLWLEGQKYCAATLEPGAVERALPAFDEARRWLDTYFSGIEPDFMPPLAPKGGAFRQAVWRLLLEIPRGSVTTYGELARRLQSESGGRASAQAVGGAVGHNPISILIPCHRVVGADGSLTGYAGGIDVKLRLLTLERAPVDQLFAPPT